MHHKLIQTFTLQFMHYGFIAEIGSHPTQQVTFKHLHNDMVCRRALELGFSPAVSLPEIDEEHFVWQPPSETARPIIRVPIEDKDLPLFFPEMNNAD